MKRTRRTSKSGASAGLARAAHQAKHHRATPGETGKGEYYHIELRPRSEFTIFRTQEVGQPGGIERVAGKRPSGKWTTQKWLISKRLAHVEQGRLVPDTHDAREILDDLGSTPVRIRGDRFRARPRYHLVEAEKGGEVTRRAEGPTILEAEAIALHQI